MCVCVACVVIFDVTISMLICAYVSSVLSLSISPPVRPFVRVHVVAIVAITTTAVIYSCVHVCVCFCRRHHQPTALMCSCANVCVLSPWRQCVPPSSRPPCSCVCLLSPPPWSISRLPRAIVYAVAAIVNVIVTMYSCASSPLQSLIPSLPWCVCSHPCRDGDQHYRQHTRVCMCICVYAITAVIVKTATMHYNMVTAVQCV